MTISTKRSAPLRVAIVGAGLMGRWHGDAARRAGGRVVAVCDRDEGAASRLAARFGAASGVELGGLLERIRPDIVHVCTPLDSHRGLVESALARGLHVIVEKPLAVSGEETRALVDLAARQARVLCPVHQLAFQRWLPRVAEIGTLLDAAYSTCSAGAEGRDAIERDRVAGEILPHPLSLFERVLPGALADARWKVSHPASGELRAQADASGALLSLSISMSGRPTRHELVLTGTRGSLHADLFHGFAWREGDHVSRAYKVARPFAISLRHLSGASVNLARRALGGERAYPGLVELLRAVFSQVEGLGPPALAADHALNVARARDAILAAW